MCYHPLPGGSRAAEIGKVWDCATDKERLPHMPGQPSLFLVFHKIHN